MLAVVRLSVLVILIVLVTLAGLVMCAFLALSSRRAKDRVYYLGKILASAARLFGLRVKTDVHPKATTVQQAVYVANHQNNFDLFTLAHVVPHGVVTVGKSSLKWIPFFGTLYWASGNFLIKRHDRDKAIARITDIVTQMKQTGLSIWMFPEGTRSRGRGWLPFKRGAFHAAIQAGVPIVPVVCSDTHGQVKLNRLSNGSVTVKVLEPISTEGLTDEDVADLVARCEQLMHEAKEAR
ncbi:1-acylglycerol-3-phosphate O-acyltransferase [Marinomonas mediterranea]|jgi:1-acyl-sn-glycerol-3-phosphate acyltransferases|uniref:1-acyl-sn-glycerol-3-phosphate acyltransferase n=1 Tax=Marinomonas mediterranea (strain ATCC 700492 / JCM 21426 / NBRC 103028 / MMB-1) TaxID=717774 RepID=F2JZK3_MARM1|nr:1-acylglycerol-3-phosphate O-acyltransferase [Marinomonas mediterranea]ADZ89786.1 1-acyl-sn-glycerol-3-phosphate acyltransferase [Marinomonas mediterranea MMB-1]WCN07875.1 1-acylglycerol-3-phosphate O-acyltransferase [Marinomonas mediterranea]WCN11970.1 1-acylglycerol-3-phosphate O-acyltransferase [Marinomonas mediterranea]WCN16008.1 1-acylglycerol-3-phosphate O-acyltransferase [Marinomonas mediterranea MMB-1]